MSGGPRALLLGARGLGLTVLVLFFLAAFTPLPNLAGARFLTPDPVVPADAIVALAASIEWDGTLGPTSLRRLVRAIELYAGGAAPLLLISGTSPAPGLDEAATRGALARRLGVPAQAIVLVAGPRDTREEAAVVAAVLQRWSARRVLIVTDWSHALRARRVFRAAGFDARVVITTDAPRAARSPRERVELAWNLGRELAANAYYRLAGYL